jgi:hypothetical protein
MSESRNMNLSILPIIGNTLFVLVLIAYGGLFAYGKILTGQIADLDASLAHSQEASNSAQIQQLLTSSNQIKSAKDLLMKHIAVSKVFNVLQTNVLPSVRFTNFDFTQNSDGTIKMDVTGEAQSYAVVAEQSALFRKIGYLQNQIFDSLDLTTKGTINIRYETNIDPALLVYAPVAGVSDAPMNAFIPSATSTSATATSTTH